MTTYVVKSDDQVRILRKMRELLKRLDQQGGSPIDPLRAEQVLQRLIEGKYDGEPGGCSIEEARAIMGPKAFIGFGEIESAFNLSFSATRRKCMERVPFDRDTLRGCVGTHVLIAGLPMTIARIRSKAPRLFRQNDNWYLNLVENFAYKEQVELGWHLVRVEGQLGDWMEPSQQTKTQQSIDFIPSAVLMVYAMVLRHMVLHTDRTFEKFCVCTSSLTSNRLSVTVGRFGLDGLILRGWDGVGEHHIGLATSRSPVPIN